ncbi:hypothetical protein ACTSKR_10480 [Chitinibacteraceae bacterium HSL-7]
MKWIAMATAAVVTLGGCASLKPEVAPDGALAVAPGQGVAVVSVTMTTLFPDTTDLAIDLVGPSGKRTLYTQSLTDMVVAPGDEANATGKLFAVPLLPGNYTVTSVWGGWMDDIGNWRHYRSFNIPRNDTFSVAAGRVVYLGDVHATVNLQPSVVLKDSRARDLNHMATRWRVTNTDNMDFRPLRSAAPQQ